MVICFIYIYFFALGGPSVDNTPSATPRAKRQALGGVRANGADDDMLPVENTSPQDSNIAAELATVKGVSPSAITTHGKGQALVDDDNEMVQVEIATRNTESN